MCTSNPDTKDMKDTKLTIEIDKEYRNTISQLYGHIPDDLLPSTTISPNQPNPSTQTVYVEKLYVTSITKPSTTHQVKRHSIVDGRIRVNPSFNKTIAYTSTESDISTSTPSSTSTSSSIDEWLKTPSSIDEWLKETSNDNE